MRRSIRFGLLALMVWTEFTMARDASDLVIIAHPNVPVMDLAVVQRVYSGRAIEVSGVPVSPANLVAGQVIRERFLALVLAQDNAQYTAYWTVRRHIGKGIPPREFRTAAELIEYVQGTPGAVGYVSEGDLRPGLRLLLMRP